MILNGNPKRRLIELCTEIGDVLGTPNIPQNRSPIGRPVIIEGMLNFRLANMRDFDEVYGHIIGDMAPEGASAYVVGGKNKAGDWAVQFYR